MIKLGKGDRDLDLEFGFDEEQIIRILTDSPPRYLYTSELLDWGIDHGMLSCPCLDLTRALFFFLLILGHVQCIWKLLDSGRWM